MANRRIALTLEMVRVQELGDRLLCMPDSWTDDDVRDVARSMGLSDDQDTIDRLSCIAANDRKIASFSFRGFAAEQSAARRRLGEQADG